MTDTTFTPEIEKGIKRIGHVLYSKKCFLCNTKFDDVLYNHKWNYEYLFHVQSTHGFPAELFIESLFHHANDDR